MKTLLSGTGVDTVSQTFKIDKQITIAALGLEPEDQVSIWLVLITQPAKDTCSCPPGQVVLPSVLDEVQLQCKGSPVVLTRNNPFVVLDAPQGIFLRVKLDTAGLNTQWVGYDETTSRINDTLRGCGCPCPEIGA